MKLTLVVDLACRLDEVLEVSTGEEIAQVDEFAVPLILDVDGAPAVLASGNVASGEMLAAYQTMGMKNCSPVNVHGVLGANDSERNDRLDLSVHSSLF